jgi:hypothetical protein
MGDDRDLTAAVTRCLAIGGRTRRKEPFMRSSTPPLATLRSARAARPVVAVLGAVGLSVLVGATALAVTVGWTRQVGTSSDDHAGGVAVDGAGITIVGTTNGRIGAENKGASDGFIRRYTPTGTVLWTRQFGTAQQEEATRVAADGTGLTVIGATDGKLTGSHVPVLGINDIFVRRYDRTGAVEWTRQIGTDAEETVGDVAAGPAGIVIAGGTSGDITGPSHGMHDVLVRRYSRTGATVWTRQFGTGENDSGSAVAIDDAGITVGGGTDGDLVGANHGPFTDAFLRRYDFEGNVLWTRQWGQEGDDQVLSLAADATGITAVGYTTVDATGDHPSQAFIRRYDRSGTLLWTHSFGTKESEIAWGVAADPTALTVTGYTYGKLDGQHLGGFDVFVRRYDRAGNVVWRTQFGTTGADLGIGVAANASGFAVVGHTSGSLGGPARGELDVFLRRYTP